MRRRWWESTLDGREKIGRVPAQPPGRGLWEVEKKWQDTNWLSIVARRWSVAREKRKDGDMAPSLPAERQMEDSGEPVACPKTSC